MPKKAQKQVESSDSNVSVVEKEPSKKKSVKVPQAPPPKEDTVDTDSSVTKTRQVPTQETVENEFNELVALVDEEIVKLRDSAVKSKGVKFLRTVNKKLKTLKTHTLRISKKRQTVRRNNTNSGFLKPVKISKELAKFTGWDHNEPRSRVDVTKYICNYIKEKNLQKTEDKRFIRVEDDPSLKTLLKFDEKEKDSEGNPKQLTYYSLQTYLKSHFTPLPKVDTVETKVSSKKLETVQEKTKKRQPK
jgi:chromatin remodeling complex protein RSC6